MRHGKFAAALFALAVMLWAGTGAADETGTLTITTSSLPAGTVGVSYDAEVTASCDSEAGLTWTVLDLPGKLTAVSRGRTCTISGTPEKEGTFTITITVASTETSSTKSFTLTIESRDLDEPITINPAELPDAGTGIDYSHALTASGRTSSWSVTSGDFPPGLTLSSDGTISGMVSDSAVSQDAPSATTFTFDVTASRGSVSDTKTFSITVYEPVRIVADSFPEGKAGDEYSAVIEIHGTRRDFRQDISPMNDAIPGLNIDASETGRITITGTPSISGTYSIHVSSGNFWGNAEKFLTLTVEGSPSSSLKPQVMPPKGLDSLIAGKDYSFQYTASGTTPITWSAEGTLPPGLSFDTSSATLSGTLLADETGKSSYMPASYDFTVTAANAGGSDTSESLAQVWYPPEIVTAAALPDAVINRSYSTEITAEGTEYLAVWRKISGNIPKGLTLIMHDNTRTCTLSGIPKETGTFLFIMSAKNSAGITQRQFTLRVNADTSPQTGSPVIDTKSLYDGETGAAYFALLEASGQSPVTWSKSGVFPKGLTLSKNGTISGIPQKPGIYNFTATARNKAGSARQNYTIRITGGTYSKPKITTKALPDAAINQPYSIQLEATGTAPLKWTFASTKYPAGLYITEDGIIAGTPKESGKFTVKVMAGNSIGSATKSYTLKVSGIAPSIITEDIPAGLKGTDYSSQLLAYGTEPLKWKKSGSLPAGLKLNPKTGGISGRPTKPGTYSFRVTATNKYGTDTRTFVVIISDFEESTPAGTATYPADISGSDTGHEELADLFVLSGDEELRGEVYAPEGEPLTFVIGTWPGGYEPDSGDIEVYINDEPIALEADGEGVFTIPGELVSDEFVVYVIADGMRTEEVYIVAVKEE